jgi:hypothetical protein
MKADKDGARHPKHGRDAQLGNKPPAAGEDPSPYRNYRTNAGPGEGAGRTNKEAATHGGGVTSRTKHHVRLLSRSL